LVEVLVREDWAAAVFPDRIQILRIQYQKWALPWTQKDVRLDANHERWGAGSMAESVRE